MDLVLARSRSGAIRKPETASCGLSPRCIYGSIIYDRVVGVCARACTRSVERSRNEHCACLFNGKFGGAIKLEEGGETY